MRDVYNLELDLEVDELIAIAQENKLVVEEMLSGSADLYATVKSKVPSAYQM